MQAKVLLGAQDRCQEGEERDLNVLVQVARVQELVLNFHLLVADEFGESCQPDQQDADQASLQATAYAARQRGSKGGWTTGRRDPQPEVGSGFVPSTPDSRGGYGVGKRGSDAKLVLNRSKGPA